MLIPFFDFPNQHVGSFYVVTIGDDGKWHRIIENSHKKASYIIQTSAVVEIGKPLMYN